MKTSRLRSMWQLLIYSQKNEILHFCNVLDHVAKDEEVERQYGIPVQSAP